MEQTQALTLTQLSFFQSHVASLSDGRSVSPSGEKCLIIKQEVVGTQMRITIMSELQEMKILLCCLHFILKLELKAIAFMG